MKRIISLLTLIFILALTACANTTPGGPDSSDTTLPPDTSSTPEETTTPPAVTIAEPDTTAPDTTDVPVGPVEPEYVNPLTGLAATKELVSSRPVAIMLNNIKIASPQDGISGADVIYECLAEGGITRLMMLTLDYASLGVVGSIRSAREYFVEFSQDFDAIFVHAGGSDGAYSEIFSRKLENLDFVNGSNVDAYYYRDEWRMNNMGYVHSVVTTGSRLSAAFEAKKFRTTISPFHENMLNFVDFGTEFLPAGGTAKSVTIPHSIVQTSSFVYDPERNVYDHYQFGGELHIDRLTKEPVSTTNVIILFMKESLVPNDPAFRINVETVGSGEGVYLYGGKFTSIKWSRPSDSDTTKLTLTDGTPLKINRGKTFISIVDTSIKNNIKVE